MEVKCKYYDKHLETILAYISCLYDITDNSCAGLLHILLDDDNIEDDHIKFCMKECDEHPEEEESKIGKLICEEFLALSIEQRRLLMNWTVHDGYCLEDGCCECYICNGD